MMGFARALPILQTAPNPPLPWRHPQGRFQKLDATSHFDRVAGETAVIALDQHDLIGGVDPWFRPLPVFFHPNLLPQTASLRPPPTVPTSPLWYPKTPQSPP